MKKKKAQNGLQGIKPPNPLENIQYPTQDPMAELRRIQSMPTPQLPLQNYGVQATNPQADLTAGLGTYPGKQEQTPGTNWGDVATSALLLTNALLPNAPIRNPVVRPQIGYNPQPQGRGSQAIYQYGGALPYPLPPQPKGAGIQNLFGSFEQLTAPIGEAKKQLMNVFTGGMTGMLPMADSGIHIDPSKRGTFTAAAKKHGKSVQAFASQVLANKENYSPAMVKKANFAKNASKWNKGENGITVSNMGYKSNSKDKNKKSLRIPSNQITMEDVQFPVLGVSDTGDTQYMLPGGNYAFDGNYVDEFPMKAQNGTMVPRGANQLRQMGQIGYPTYPGSDIEGDTIDPLRMAARNNYMGTTQSVSDFYYLNPLTSPESTSPKASFPMRKWRAENLFGIPNYKGTAAQNSQLLKMEQSDWNSPPQYQTGGIVGTPEQRAAANAQAQRLAAKYNLMDPSNMQIGQYLPQYVDSAGRPYQGSPTRPLPNRVPPGINIEDIQSEQGLFWFIDPDTGDPVDVAPTAVRDLQFRKSQGQQATDLATRSVEMNLRNKQFNFSQGGKIKKRKKYANGGSIRPLTEDTFQFQGPSHDNGGIDISYAGNQVEVEGDETGYIAPDGSLNIMGNMYNPLTGRKFKEDSKRIAKKEQQIDKLLDYSVDLVNNADMTDKWGILKFNSGKVQMEGAFKKKAELQQSKEHLSTIQNAMLEYADENGIDPNAFSKGKFKPAEENGTAQDGKKIRFKGMPFPQSRGALRDLRKKYIEKNLNIDEVYPGISNFIDNGVEPYQFDINNPFGQPQKQASAPATQAATTSNTITTAPLPQEDAFITQLKTSIGAAESSNRYNVPAGGGSSAFGKYQFTKGTRKGIWESNFKSQYKTFEDFDRAYKSTPDVQEATMTAHLNRLRATYGDDPTAIALVHRLGPGGYEKVKKDPTLLNKAVSKSVPESGDKETPAQYLTKLGIPTTVDLPTTPSTQIDITEPMKVPGTVYNPKEPTYPGAPARGRVPGANYDLGITNTRYQKPSDAQGLPISQILPELYTAATNRVEPVFMQEYTPDLYQDYRVSFQDRLNENQATFRTLAQAMADDPASLATLAAQKYQADNQVLAEEFRTNQAIEQDVTNKNIALLNDAELRNLSLADNQYVRQSTARSKTKQQNQIVLQSISDKIHQNALEQRTLRTYENLYPNYSFGEDYIADYTGPEAGEALNWQPVYQPLDQNAQVTVRTDAKGNVSTTKKYPSTVQQSLQNIQLSTNKLKYNDYFLNKQRNIAKNYSRNK